MDGYIALVITAALTVGYALMTAYSGSNFAKKNYWWSILLASPAALFIVFNVYSGMGLAMASGRILTLALTVVMVVLAVVPFLVGYVITRRKIRE